MKNEKEQKNNMREAIQKAIEGGWESPLCSCEATESNPEAVCKNMGTNLPCCPDSEVLIDPLFWQALGKAMGWGEWNMKLEDVKHEWELVKYLPDTAKTPVYECKCGARKVNDIIEIEDNEYNISEIKKGEWSKRHALYGHGGYRRKTWQQNWHRFIDHLAEGKSPDDFFNDLLT